MTKDAEYYIDQVLIHAKTIDEMQKLNAEIDEWYYSASPEEQQKFTESGAGECLEMCCS